MTAAVAAALIALAGPPFEVGSSIADGASTTGTVRWEAIPSGTPADHVEFVVDGWVRHVANRAPFVFEWDTAKEADGEHTLELWAVARDRRVARATARVSVSNVFALAVTSLRDGAAVRGNVRWQASVEGSAPEWVEFVVDGHLRATDSKPPYAWSWLTGEDANGKHRLTVWAVAPNGRVATESIEVQVANRGFFVGPALAERYRLETWRWESLMRVPLTRPGQGVDFWRGRAEAARRRASRPPHWREFLCIHRYEGAWSARTGNGYYGGLQMNMDFMRGYGPELLRTKGTADKWTPLEQIWVAERAVPRRGFQPWPQTARMCGLLP
jgi:hypothetical protein